MKRLLYIISVFVMIFCINIVAYADESVTEPATTEQSTTKVNVDDVIDNPDSTDVELLRAILVCLKDIDIYVQFFVTLVFAIGLVYFVLFKPIRYFLN